MGRRKNGIAEQFQQLFEAGASETEQQFLESLNTVIRSVELSDDYNTNQKLKIYELISQIANCMPDEREKYAKKLTRVLK